MIERKCPDCARWDVCKQGDAHFCLHDHCDWQPKEPAFMMLESEFSAIKLLCDEAAVAMRKLELTAELLKGSHAIVHKLRDLGKGIIPKDNP